MDLVRYTSKYDSKATRERSDPNKRGAAKRRLTGSITMLASLDLGQAMYQKSLLFLPVIWLYRSIDISRSGFLGVFKHGRSSMCFSW